MKMSDFVVFILTHGRPNNVYTYSTLRKQGYTGRIVFVIDDEDECADEYFAAYGRENVVMFNKAQVAEKFDEIIPGDRRTIVYARNACFDIAEYLGCRYFMELDDDYTAFRWRFDNEFNYLTGTPRIKNLDAVFNALLEFYKAIPAKSIAMAQGGDFVAGRLSKVGREVGTKRKAMNSFICDTQRRFTFIGRINEDVNTYVWRGMVGDIFLQTSQVDLQQKQTQSNKGGMTDVYVDSGTYLKSFFSVMVAPSCVKIGLMGNKKKSEQKRLHHVVAWKKAVPKIISEKCKKNNGKNGKK